MKKIMGFFLFNLLISGVFLAGFMAANTGKKTISMQCDFGKEIVCKAPNTTGLNYCITLFLPLSYTDNMDFKKILSALGYSLGLPGAGISEPVGTPWSAERSPNNVYPTTIHNPVGPSVNQAPVNKTPVPFYGPATSSSPVPNTQPTNTGGGGGGGQSVAAPSGGNGADAAALAELARRHQIDSYKEQARGIRDTAQNNFNDILKAVNAFRDRSKTAFTNAGQEIVDKASEILGTNARTVRELEGETRAKGRALGLGDSSKFNTQNKLAANLAATQGNTLATKGQQDRANQLQYQERQDQAQTQEDQAGSYLRGANDRAQQVENTGYNAATDTFASALNDIVNYQRSLAAINPLNANGVTTYTPNFSGILNTINGVLTGTPGGGQNDAADMGNPVNPTDIFTLLKRRGLAS